MYFLFKPEGHGLQPKLRWALLLKYHSGAVVEIFIYCSSFRVSKAAHFLVAHFQRGPVADPPELVGAARSKGGPFAKSCLCHSLSENYEEQHCF